MAIDIECDSRNRCEHVEESYGRLRYFGRRCDETSYLHSTMCEEHGGVSDYEGFLGEWELHLNYPDQICEHVDDGEEPEKIEAFKRGELQ